MSISIKELLSQGNLRLQQHSDTPTLDAQVLVAHSIGKPRSWVMAHPEYELDEQQYRLLDQALLRLERGEPLPYVIGHWEFFGLEFDLTPDVLIPRPETELLVERSIDWLRHHPQRRHGIDVGTGSGCIGIALATSIPDLRLLMTDISPAALDVAKRNAHKLGVSDRLQFQQADLLDGVDGVFDFLCANLPYVPHPTLNQLAVSKREPILALDGGGDGTRLIFRLLDQSPQHLTLGGLLLMEIEASQGSAVKSYAQSSYPVSKVQVLKDLAGNDRLLQIERSRFIVHLCKKGEWLNAQQQEAFLDKSLENEGFIHCSTPEQILPVANRFYHGLSELVLLWIDPDLLTSELQWEHADGENFPHIYGPINPPAVVKTTNLEPDNDGTFNFIQAPD